ncbi:MAG TPA: DUF3147 family protein [Acidobacteriaceae bacterium]|nr:DUF3147 family protein [Acidobacteriaceae bacterium]
MRIGFDMSSLRLNRWSDYGVRFLFGGLVTVLTGVLANRYGPGVAGLFLAFPAIFPAGATLIEKHEKEKKRQAGWDGTVRGRMAASVDAAGAAMGSVGLIGFALVVWRFLPAHSAPAILVFAGAAWLATSILVWWIRKAL